MKRAVAGIAVILLGLAGPVTATEQFPPSQEVEIGSALTVTATESITTIGLVVTITSTPRFTDSGPVEGTYPARSVEIN